MINNDFFNQPVKGPIKEIPISEAVSMALGGRVFLSKRLSPPMTICNGRIYVESLGQHYFVFSSDIEVMKAVRPLTAIAEKYEVVIRILHESGNEPVWSSALPDIWLGYAINKNTNEQAKGMTLADVYPWFEQQAKERQSQWRLDHGLRRRTAKEWLHDFWFYRVKCGWYELGRKLRNLS